ncbi:MAG: DUF4168 domain-containing protein [Spirochaetia bacterium]
MRLIKIAPIALTVLLLFSQGLFAQYAPDAGNGEATAEYTDEQLENFVAAIQDIQIIQEEVNEEIDDIISDSELSEERFSELYGLSQQGQDALSDVPQEEAEVFQGLMQDITTTQQEMQTEMVAIVEDNDMSVESFNQISSALQQDPQLMERVRGMMN